MSNVRRRTVPNWNKVLFRKQQVRDNYTDSTFLSQLRKNVFQRPCSFKKAALPLCAVTLEISCTLLFVATFAFLDRGSITTKDLLWYSGYFVGFCFFLLLFTGITTSLRRNKISVVDMIKKSIAILLLGFVLSPVLKTLTQTVSTDTIYAMVAGMLFVHVAVQDYFPRSKRPYSYVSLNSALFAVVCLASQLRTIEDTFLLTIFAFQIFIFVPCYRVVIQEYTFTLVFSTALFALVVALMLYFLKPIYTILFAITCAFVNVFCPQLFVRFQVYKENIHGPWDEAVIVVEEGGGPAV